jgi:hypothetical protein
LSTFKQANNLKVISMKISKRILATSVAFLLMTGTGLALSQTTKFTCVNIGSGVPEPLGDRDGHAVQVSGSACTAEGGLLDGMVMTQDTIWEIEIAKGTFNLLSSHGVSRKAGATTAYRSTSGTLTTTMKDGKPTGWTVAGKGTYTLATGSAAALAGKNFSFTGYATGLHTYVLVSTLD